MPASSWAAPPLEGRRVILTGATGGIGRQVALRCAAQGAVVGLGHRAGPGHEAAVTRVLLLQQEILALGGPAPLPLVLDVTQPAQIEQALATFVAHAGGVDGWINNAGVNRPGLLVSAELADIEEQLRTNLLGPILCARAVLPVLLRARGGVIINIGSVAADRPYRGQAAYAASKGGVAALTRALAVEYGQKGIRVCGVAPGPIDTEMLDGARALGQVEVKARTPLRRIGRPEDVAALCAYLLTESAAFLTGAVYAVDGGYLAG